MVEVKEYQQAAATRLKSLIGQDDIDVGWRAFSGQGRRIYQPIVDVAVGPYAIDDKQYGPQYDVMVEKYKRLIDSWASDFQTNWQSVIGEIVDNHWLLPPRTPASHDDFLGPRANQNARCFIAIEIENETSRKHLMGSIVNAGALGRIGILIAWQPKVLRAALRMREYFNFLQSVKKRSFDMGGVVIVTQEQFAQSLGMQI